jgi:hypothetical protein
MKIVTPKDFAKRINGREYRNELTEEDEKLAEENHLVVVFGWSDDLVEFRGKIHGELDAYDGVQCRIDCEGPQEVWEAWEEKTRADAMEFFRRENLQSSGFKAKWDHEDYSWWMTINTRHSAFDVMEDGEKYCRGIVFDVRDIGMDVSHFTKNGLIE